MATVYSQAENNIRKTWLLMGSLSLLTLGIGWFLSYYFNSLWILIAVALWVLGEDLYAYWRADRLVLRSVRAVPLKKEEEPELDRIVENLCLTAGLPKPKVYIMEENQPNAFATGRDKNHATIVVTRGLLEQMNKNELAGVIAHELSHIKNRDILLGTVVVVLVGIISSLSYWTFRLGFSRQDRDRGQGDNAVLLIGLIGLILAPLAAAIIQASISRKREFLADASGVLLTRYPEGLISALQKIGRYEYSMKKVKPVVTHLFIASPFRGESRKSWLVRLFDTHPPLEERIKRLQMIK